MSQHSFAEHDRWEELQTARLLYGLTEAEEAEFEFLARQLPAEQQDRLEMVVAALDLAWSNMPSEKLPEHLRRAIHRQAEQLLAAKPDLSVVKPEIQNTKAIRWSKYLPWLVSAACLLFAIMSWTLNQPAGKTTANLAQQRAELLALKDGILQVNWSAGPTPAGNASGDVVWSSARQTGFMRFRGLPANAPATEQYQLWIFDKNQSDKTPIDGGVFDITPGEEVIVAINPKLHVKEPFMFAITVEKPGGVVVSTRERLPLLAKIE
jgi:hypothetical protein